LHHRGRAFLIPNPWDAGTARLLAGFGFEALATTSAGCAFSRGRPDGSIERDAMLDHIADIVAATDLPVSADLETGFGDAPETVAATIRSCAARGAAGGSIEDTSRTAASGLYELAHAVERVRAAAETARALPSPFMLTARAENYMVGRPDLAETIARLQAFQDAGADVLYAPGLRTTEEIRTLVGAVDRPVNVLMGMAGTPLDLATLSALGVKRVSVGSALARTALGAFLRAAREMHDRGTFTFASEAVSYQEMNRMLTPADYS
jgi:2-methylisocitrate lyase-like PEP mutase family enzyme